MSEIPFQIIRSDRKSIAIIIDSEANLIVRAPRRVRQSEIMNFIDKKKRWIMEKQRQAAVFNEKHSPVTIETGKSLLYLGNTYTIHRDHVPAIRFAGATLFIPEGYSLNDVIAWMKDAAETILAERVSRYAGRMGIGCSAIKLSDAKSRWGMCSAKNNLRFAWRLIMCPIAVIDYVVVHELSHITYKNHGASFWALVKAVLPNYKDHRNWLKQNRKIMEII